MEFALINQVYISYISGSGGNFLRHFLDPQIKLSKAKYWVDQAWHTKKGGGGGDKTAYPYADNSHIQFGPYADNSHIQFGFYTKADFIIGLGPVNYCEFIKTRVMMNTKNAHRNINQIDDIIVNIQSTDTRLFTSNVSFLLSYDQLFDFGIMSKLYLRVNDATVPDYKKQYFLDYKAKHDEVFNSWQYNVIERICLFEYNNNCVEHISGKMRNWNIDEITEDNYESLLKEKLCLTNYS